MRPGAELVRVQEFGVKEFSDLVGTLLDHETNHYNVVGWGGVVQI
jgi:hypothetical protein